MPVTRIAIVSIPVADPERSRRFFVDQLGFAVLRDDDSVPGMRWIMVAPSGGSAAMVLANWFESMRPGSLRGLVLETANLEVEHRRLDALGVDFVEAPRRQPWAFEAVFQDPDGNQFVLQEAR